MTVFTDPHVDALAKSARTTALLDAARAILQRKPKTYREAADIVANLDGPLIEIETKSDARCDECGALFTVGPMGVCPCGSRKLSSPRF